MNNILGAIDIKLTADGRKDIMWVDSDKFPRLMEIIMVLVPHFSACETRFK